MRSFFQRGDKFQPLQGDDERPDQEIPGGLWVKCPRCGELIYNVELEHSLHVCPKCGYHHRLRARARLSLLTDGDSFQEWDRDLNPADPLDFKDGSGSYSEKLHTTQRRSGEVESLVTGRAEIEGQPTAIAVADFDFLGASMGSVFGEKLARVVERAIAEGLPVLTVNASGGARMHEGFFSLMQMAKTISGMRRLGEAKLPHISLLTDPCYGGVTASYATVADVILAEPGALVGFAGPRVIEQITKQKLPEGFQTAEFLLEHGMIDLIVERPMLRTTLRQLLSHYRRATNPEEQPTVLEQLIATDPAGLLGEPLADGLTDPGVDLPVEATAGVRP